MAAVRFIAALALVAACAPVEPRRSVLPPGETPVAEPEQKEVVVCHEETPTGSNISRNICRTEEVRKHDRDDVMRTMEETRPCGQCGGGAQPLARPLPGPPGSH